MPGAGWGENSGGELRTYDRCWVVSFVQPVLGVQHAGLVRELRSHTAQLFIRLIGNSHTTNQNRLWSSFTVRRYKRRPLLVLYVCAAGLLQVHVF